MFGLRRLLVQIAHVLRQSILGIIIYAGYVYCLLLPGSQSIDMPECCLEI